MLPLPEGTPGIFSLVMDTVAALESDHAGGVASTIVPGDAGTVPSGNVKVPAAYYKVLLRTGPDGTPADALAIVLPNALDRLPVPPGTRGVQGDKVSAREADAFLAARLVSIREPERQAGLDLLPRLDAEALKQAVASELWPRS